MGAKTAKGNETAEEEKETLLPEQPPPPHPAAKFLVPKTEAEKRNDTLRRSLAAGNGTAGNGTDLGDLGE